jgi:protein SCO1/2
MTRRGRPAAAAGLATLLAAGCGGGGGESAAPVPSASFGWHGVEPQDGPVPRAEFVLRDTAGRRFDFARETQGQPTLVYFGYTNCPDECPTAMADIAAALRQSDVALREQVKVVVVTTDPQRDTPPVLRRWLDQFSQDFIGLVGTQAEVDAAQEAAGLEPAKKGGAVETLPGKPNEHVHKPGTAAHKHFGPLGYGVGHANLILAYNADDLLPVAYPGGVRPSDIAADLPELAED